jgi:hypothetical protein
MMQSLNPSMYLKWMMAPLDPRWIQAMITPMNPAAYTGWLGAMMNPASYGDLWKGFLTVPAQPAATAAYGVPSAAAPYSFNPFDPNAWSQVFAMPGTTGVPSAAGAAPAASTPYLINPFDPNSWAQIWQLPYVTAPAQPAPAAK